MSFRARIQISLMILLMTALALQGCSVSSDGGDGGADGGGRAGDGLSLELLSENGRLTLVADGNDNILITLEATDGSGPIANTPVRFTTTAGTWENGAEAFETATGGDGVASARLTSSTTVETATVIAEILGFTKKITVSFVSGIPAAIVLNAVPSTLAPNGQTNVQATVREADGTPVEGAKVVFEVTTSNTGGVISPFSGVSDTNGQVIVGYTAGAIVGTDVVTGVVSATLSDTINITVQTTTITPSIVELFVSSTQMDSDGSETVDLTAVVRDINNNLLSGVDIAFAADSGELVVISDVTDASGTASATLSTLFDPSNRTITVTAAAGTLVGTNTVEVTGTTLVLSGTNAMAFNEISTLSLLLQDSGNNGIAGEAVNVTSEIGNEILDAQGQPIVDTDGDGFPDVTTDSNGQAVVQVRGTMAGTDTISADALGATTEFVITVSSDTFTFIAPDAGTEVDLNTPEVVTVRWLQNGVPVVGGIINFTTTRGTLTGGDQSPASDSTDANGEATVNVSANTAGPAIITASAAGGGPSNQRAIEFVATDPVNLVLQVTPTTIGVNAGTSTDQQSVVTAIVRDPNGNLVKNQIIDFVLTDSSGGFIFPSAATTDSFGRASTVYTAGSVSSAQNGVQIEASVVGAVPALTDVVFLTVAEQEVFIVLGTDNRVQGLADARYAKRYTALVSDANGNPIEGATIELSLFPTRYQKGFYQRVFEDPPANTRFAGWFKRLSINAGSGVADDTDRACDNEDQNRNGVLDALEDFNQNGILDPRNVAEVPGSVTTDADGFAIFDVSYTRDMTWVEVVVTARVSVVGSEDSASVTFFLPGLLSDFDNKDVAPPGTVSPFGTATSCICDELNPPLAGCPAITGPVVIAPLAEIIPAPANSTTQPFSISGGTEITYTVSSSSATAFLTNVTTMTAGANGAPITVNFGQTFTLTETAANLSGAAIPAPDRTITITAVDTNTAQSGTAIVTQEGGI